MILADTSIWIDHFRKPIAGFQSVIAEGRLLTHDLVIAELALGSVPDRSNLLTTLGLLPQGIVITAVDLLDFIEDNGLIAVGIGYVDAHLLASVAAAEGATIWTRDKRLAAQAEKLGIAHKG